MRNILFVAIAVAATSALTACGKKETATVAPPEVLVIEAPTRDVPVYREWIGTFDGSHDAEIKAHVTGYLIKRDYQEGTLVKKETYRALLRASFSRSRGKRSLSKASGHE